MFWSASGVWRPVAKISAAMQLRRFQGGLSERSVDMALTYKRIGRDFDPSIGFVPGAACSCGPPAPTSVRDSGAVRFSRCSSSSSRRSRPNSSGRWESYRVFMAPVNWRFRSGDRVEFNVDPDRRAADGAIRDRRGVFIPPGSYDWLRYRLEAGTAKKRRLYTQVTWWFGDFYNGKLDQINGPAPGTRGRSSRLNSPANGTWGACATGDFTQTVVGTGCGSTSLPICRCQLHPVRHRQRIGRGRTRDCAGRSVPSRTSSSSTTTTCDRSSTGGGWTPTSCW